MTDARLTGLRVAAFESRRAAELAQLIRKAGGEPHVSPSMREVPLDRLAPVAEYARGVIDGTIEVSIFLTGVGFRHLLQALEAAHATPDVRLHADPQAFLTALGRSVTVVRGPKPFAAMKEHGLAPTHRVPSPNTWRELLATLDQHVPLAGRKVAVQEYGLPNPHLLEGLAARGADVLPLQVYRWDLPEDVAPLRANIQALADGQRDVALFTSAHQVVNVLRVASELGLVDNLRAALERVAVASIGPTTSEMLREMELPVDIEPAQHNMGSLVQAAAREAAAVLANKAGGA